MKKSKIRTKKLTLSREILRCLLISDLQKVAGGTVSGEGSCVDGRTCFIDEESFGGC